MWVIRPVLVCPQTSWSLLWKAATNFHSPLCDRISLISLQCNCCFIQIYLNLFPQSSAPSVVSTVRACLKKFNLEFLRKLSIIATKVHSRSHSTGDERIPDETKAPQLQGTWIKAICLPRITSSRRKAFSCLHMKDGGVPWIKRRFPRSLHFSGFTYCSSRHFSVQSIPPHNSLQRKVIQAFQSLLHWIILTYFVPECRTCAKAQYQIRWQLVTRCIFMAGFRWHP